MLWDLKNAPDKTNQLDVPLQEAMSLRLATLSQSLQISTGAGIANGSQQFKGLGGAKPRLSRTQVAHMNMMSDFPLSLQL